MPGTFLNAYFCRNKIKLYFCRSNRRQYNFINIQEHDKGKNITAGNDAHDIMHLRHGTAIGLVFAQAHQPLWHEGHAPLHWQRPPRLNCPQPHMARRAAKALRIPAGPGRAPRRSRNRNTGRGIHKAGLRNGRREHGQVAQHFWRDGFRAAPPPAQPARRNRPHHRPAR